MNIYFDLDGTLLDTFGRHTTAHRLAVEKLGGLALAAEHYWACKRLGVSEEHVAALSSLGDRGADYPKARKSLLETEELLALDEVRPEAAEVLSGLRERGHRLVLATLRRDIEALETQLERTGLAPLLDEVLARGEARGSWTAKRDMIRADLAEHPNQALFVGDTEGDILAAKACEMPVLVLTCGSRSPARLALYSPQGQMESLTELIDIIKK